MVKQKHALAAEGKVKLQALQLASMAGSSLLFSFVLSTNKPVASCIAQ